VPVQTGFLDHKVMTPPVKCAVHGHDEHDDIDDHPGEHVKTMETRNGEEEIREIGRWH
jgi:hypothetical protein